VTRAAVGVHRPELTAGRPRLAGSSLPGWATLGPLLLGGVGLGCWSVSLDSVDLRRMTDYGLLPALPATWYVGVGLVLAGAVAAICRRTSRPVLVALLTGALVVMLYGTLPLVTDVPQYAWTYKHIGVTRYIELHGSVNPNIDIYHRWPGFFTLTAMFSTIAGTPDPVRYAAWSEVFFTGVATILIAAIGRRLLRDTRLGWLAALLFVLFNWIGQSYFAPQALAFTLTFGIYLLVFDHFCRPRPTRPQLMLLRLVRRLARRPLMLGSLHGGAGDSAAPTADGRAGTRDAELPTQFFRLDLDMLDRRPDDDTLLIGRPDQCSQPAVHNAGVGTASARTETGTATAAASTRWPRWASFSLILLLQLAVVSSHQLTPYMVIIGMVLLTGFGIIRPWWLAASIAAVTIAYFVPNYHYVESNFGLFSGLNPLSNVQTSGAASSPSPAPGKIFYTRAGTMLTLVMLVLGFIGLVRWLRRGDARALVPATLVIGAGLLVVGQSYGGEGILRVVLFAGPWLCILAARALAPADDRWGARRSLLILPVTALLGALFLPSFFGQSELNILPADEVRAVQHLYDAATPGRPIFIGAPFYPAKLAANYDQFPSYVPSIIDLDQFRGRQLGPADINSVVDYMRGFGDHSYLVITASQETYIEINHTSPPGALRSMERGLIESGHLSLWYQTASTRIYEFRASTS
jgi:hypothetical protein